MPYTAAPLRQGSQEHQTSAEAGEVGHSKKNPSLFMLQDSFFGFFSPRALFGTQEGMPDYFFSVGVLQMNSWGCSLSCTELV